LAVSVRAEAVAEKAVEEWNGLRKAVLVGERALTGTMCLGIYI
jgi:hypothetical protein